MAETVAEDTDGRWADDGGVTAKFVARVGTGAETEPQKIATHQEPSRLVKINGGAEWGEYGLKHGIAEYVNGLLAGAFDDMKSPCISFGSITLKLRRDSGEYIAYGEPTGDVALRVRIPDMELHSSARANELALNLLRFALNDRWRTLIVDFGLGRQLRIWKKTAGYGIVGFGLPLAEELCGLRIWDWHPHS